MNRKCITICVATFLIQSALWAQQTASSGIVGQVTDATQSAIAGATVTVVNTGTSAQRTATTDTAGNFSVPNLPPATYEIRVEKSGFQTAVRRFRNSSALTARMITAPIMTCCQ